MYEILLGNRARKNLRRLPNEIQVLFKALAKDLMENGAEQLNWKNYSKLSKEKYHCHLNYNYVACWTHKENTITIEVYYVGSREGAPY